MPAMRIVSLLPSATEIVCSLGAAHELVGISHECDYPAEIQKLPRLTKPQLDPLTPSRAIHETVAKRAQQGLSLYEVDVEQLAALKPDIVITQDQCEVCAVSLEEVEKALHEMVGAKPKICSLQPQNLKEVGESFLQVAVMIDRFKDGVHLAKQFWDRLREVSKGIATEERPRIACVEWLDPLMIAGHWTPELVKLAGGAPIIVADPERFATITTEELLEARPDAVLVMPCGFDLPRTEQEFAYTDQAFWKNLKDSARLGVYFTDGNQFFNRSGPRLVESAEIIACVLGTASPEMKEKHAHHLKEAL